MNRRESFRKTLNHEQPDSVIIDFGGNPLSSMEGKSMHRLLEYLGYDYEPEEHVLPFGRVSRLDKRILEHFDIDTRSVGTILAPQKSQNKWISDVEHIDEWGIRRKFTGMYWDIVENPLRGASAEALEKYEWPDPDTIDPACIERYADEAKRLYHETDFVICAEHPFYGIFELGCWMCGFDDFLLRIAIDTDFVHRFFEIILEYQKRIIEIYYGSLGQYIHYTSSGDDFATQDSLFISPDMFRQLIKPYFKQRIEYTKKYTSAAFLHHSCGSVFPIIGDLIDCGVEILNPIQPKARLMDFYKLKETFGDHIVFHGGIDTQDILPFGNKNEIEKTVKDTVEILGKNGGYIFAAAHNIQEDVPPQNLVYLLESAKAFCR